MRKFLSLLLALLMLPLPGALAAEKYETLPEHMQMTQSFEHERLGNNVSIDRAWPVTANESVNAELRAAIDQLETQGRAFLPARATRDKEGALLDVGAHGVPHGRKLGLLPDDGQRAGRSQADLHRRGYPCL